MDMNFVSRYCSMIKYKINESRFESAIDSAQKLLYNYPDCETGYYYMGVCQFALEKYDESAKNYLKAIELNPAFAKAYFNLGVCHYLKSEYDNALINIGKALIIFSKQKELDSKERCYNAIKLIESMRKK